MATLLITVALVGSCLADTQVYDIPSGKVSFSSGSSVHGVYGQNYGGVRYGQGVMSVAPVKKMDESVPSVDPSPAVNQAPAVQHLPIYRSDKTSGVGSGVAQSQVDTFIAPFFHSVPYFRQFNPVAFRQFAPIYQQNVKSSEVPLEVVQNRVSPVESSYVAPVVPNFRHFTPVFQQYVKSHKVPASQVSQGNVFQNYVPSADAFLAPVVYPVTNFRQFSPVSSTKQSVPVSNVKHYAPASRVENYAPVFQQSASKTSVVPSSVEGGYVHSVVQSAPDFRHYAPVSSYRQFVPAHQQDVKVSSVPTVSSVDTGFVVPSVHLRYFASSAVAKQVSPVYHQQVVKSAEAPAAIIIQNQDSAIDGSFVANFETENGIESRVSGEVRPAVGGDEAGQVVSGSYPYTASDGSPLVAAWAADEPGVRAQRGRIPAVPVEIHTPLEYIHSFPVPLKGIF